MPRRPAPPLRIRRRRPIGRLILRMAAAFVAVTVFPVLALRFLDPPTSAFMLRHRVLSLFGEAPPLRQAWVDWDDISTAAKLAVIASEDQKFADHSGFDVASIRKAWDHNEKGRRLRGASTISQQLAKNLFLWPGRSWVRKGLEAWFTLWIEALWPKRRVLEVYLNVVEFGPGVFGVGAAAEAFFDRPASDLDRRQAALLAAVLPNPKRYSAARPSGYVRTRASWIQLQMGRLGAAAVEDL